MQIDISPAGVVPGAAQKSPPGESRETIMRSTSQYLSENSDSEFEVTGSASSADASAGEVQEMELAAQLLEITNDSELDQFITDQLQGAARTIGSALPASVLQPLTQALRRTLRHTLRFVGSSR